MKIKLLIMALIALAFEATSFVRTGHAHQNYITIGTAGVSGVYYPSGGAICRLINKDRKEHGLRCSVEATDGSAYNILALSEGDFEFGLTQSDVQAAAWNGTLDYKKIGRYKDLRSLFSLHTEPLHLVVRSDSKIEKFEDVLGKRINIGNVGSGQLQIMTRLLDHLGWGEKDFSFVGNVKSGAQSKALCNNQLDAAFFTAGVPNASVKETVNSCDTKIIPIEGPWLDGFLKKYPEYARTIIPAKVYQGTDKAVKTFGPAATVVTSAQVSEKTVYILVKAVFDHFEDFKELHPAFYGLRKENMVRNHLTAPLHEGAARYFRENNLLK